MRKVLSIDGGGIRGIIPSLVLDYLERESSKPISELFDLCVGTSSGGIIALGLAQADAAGAPKYSAHDLAVFLKIVAIKYLRGLFGGIFAPLGVFSMSFIQQSRSRHLSGNIFPIRDWVRL